MTNRVLVVDDEADLELLVRQKFRKRITAGDLEFMFARNGEEALRKLEEDRTIEIVLTDVNMPVMDGLTLLSRVAGLPQLLRTVVVSAYDDMENIRAAMNRGAFDFLTKPIDFEDLEQTLDKTLREVEIIRNGIQARDQLALIDYELEVATRIQKSILPENIEGREEFEISATMLPARQVSGDFYDYFFIDTNRLGLVIGDVSGKGIPAALYMAVSRTLLRATALQGGPPAECLDHVNRVLLKQSDGEVFLTLFYGILDLITGEFEYSAGGQTPPYLFSPHLGGRFLREPRGMMLGLLDEAVFESCTINLQPGEGLVLYTDGVTEADNSREEFFAESRLKTMIEGSKTGLSHEIVAALLREIRVFTEGRPQSDDITLLVFRYRPG